MNQFHHKNSLEYFQKKRPNQNLLDEKKIKLKKNDMELKNKIEDNILLIILM